MKIVIKDGAFVNPKGTMLKDVTESGVYCSPSFPTSLLFVIKLRDGKMVYSWVSDGFCPTLIFKPTAGQVSQVFKSDRVIVIGN